MHKFQLVNKQTSWCSRC